jgi:GNAT superfamily N-acetyltransferase
MKPTNFEIREARFPEDAPLALRFIMGLQRYERAFEPHRRIDTHVAKDYLAVLRERADKNGRILIAQNKTGEALGWAVVHEDKEEIYVVPEERCYARINELYVESEGRGRGVGRVLIAACEDWARGRNYKQVMIGACSENALAMGVYQGLGYTPYTSDLRKYL